MPHKRPTAIAGTLLALVTAAATLSSCGFDYPTDRVNTIAAGVNNREGHVNVLGLRILATAPGDGRLIGALANNLTESASLTGISSPADVSADKFKPIEVPGSGAINLATYKEQIALTGGFTAGDVVPLELTFDNGQSVSLDVPVVKRCFQYTAVPTESAQATESASAGKGKATDGAAADAAAEEQGQSSSESPSEGTDGATEGAGGSAAFSCADEAPSPSSAEGH